MGRPRKMTLDDLSPPRSRPKPKPVEASSIFLRRSCQMFHNQKRRAAEDGAVLNFTLADLRGLIAHALRLKFCAYCGAKLTASNFSGDHKHPVCRGGGYAFDNLEVICLRCNLAKGPLDRFEFRQIMQAMAQWHPSLRDNTLARLRAGASRARYNPPACEANRRVYDFGPGRVPGLAQGRTRRGKAQPARELPESQALAPEPGPRRPGDL